METAECVLRANTHTRQHTHHTTRHHKTPQDTIPYQTTPPFFVRSTRGSTIWLVDPSQPKRQFGSSCWITRRWKAVGGRTMMCSSVFEAHPSSPSQPPPTTHPPTHTTHSPTHTTTHPPLHLPTHTEILEDVDGLLQRAGLLGAGRMLTALIAGSRFSCALGHTAMVGHAMPC